MPSSHPDPAASTRPFDYEAYDIESLLAMLRALVDPRDARGVIFPLHYLLALALIATLAGARSLSAMGRLIADDDVLTDQMIARLGAPFDHFTGRYRRPCEKTLRDVLNAIDVKVLDSRFGRWLLAHRAWNPGEELEIAFDGKVLRGTWAGEDKQVTLLAAMIHEEALVIGQLRVPDKTNETPKAPDLIEELPEIVGPAVATLDAAHTQDYTANALVAKGIDYVIAVKLNKEALYRKLFDMMRPGMREAPEHEVVERKHGRIKSWKVWTRPLTAEDEIEFPHAAVCAVIRRDEYDLANNHLTKEFAFFLASATRREPTAVKIHKNVRGHWGIENLLHYVRDTVWREDDYYTEDDNTSHALASLRNLAIGIIHLNGENEITKAVEKIGRKIDRVFPVLATACSRSSANE